MLNVAARSHQQLDRLHPYAGGGLGLALAEADISGSLAVNGITFAPGNRDNHASLALQVFLGLDMDLSERVYTGVNVRYFWTDTELFGAEMEFGNVAATATLGYRF